MGKEKTKAELIKHKEQTLSVLDAYVQSLIDSEDVKSQGKADKLSYWINDWVKFLEYEPSFSSNSLRRYKRGEIIKVHLGFNIGSEEGGLHYAVVVDKDNSIYNPVLTVIPLTSLKPKKDITKLRKGEIFLGNELYVNMSSKLAAHLRFLDEKSEWIDKELDELTASISDCPDFCERLEIVKREHLKTVAEIEFLHRLKDEFDKMKRGSIALVNQITTISKIRIYDPKTNHDVLSGIKLSNEKLDMIDKEVASNYTNLKHD